MIDETNHPNLPLEPSKLETALAYIIGAIIGLSIGFLAGMASWRIFG